MKNYDETISSVFDRINEYKAARKRKRRVAMGACSFCLVALIGIWVWQSGMFGSEPPVTLGDSTVIGETDYVDDRVVASTPAADWPVIWAEGGIVNSAEEALGDWNGKVVNIDLLSAFQENSDECYFAILARVVLKDGNFVYNGKTLAQYTEELEAAQYYFETLSHLLKLGDSLKYGEALYQTGTPEGEKWTKALYEETVENFGEELLSKYIVDGVFLREQVEAAMADYSEGKAQTAYNSAYAAYISQTLEAAQKQLIDQNIDCDRPPNANYLIICVTKDTFTSLTMDHIENWVFVLAPQNIGSFESEVSEAE